MNKSKKKSKYGKVRIRAPNDVCQYGIENGLKSKPKLG